VFFYFGPHVDRFDDVFREIGLVIALPPSLRQEGAA
jgi:hypothetical protein